MPPPSNGDGIKLVSPREDVTLSVSGSDQVYNSMTIEEDYSRSLADINGTIGLKVLGEDWYALSWTKGNYIIYKKVYYGTGSRNILYFTCTASSLDYYAPIIEHIEASFMRRDITSAH